MSEYEEETIALAKRLPLPLSDRDDKQSLSRKGNCLESLWLKTWATNRSK